MRRLCALMVLPLLAGAWPPPPAAQEVSGAQGGDRLQGRLFTTPDQRRRLDNLRHRQATREVEQSAAVVSKPKPEPMPRVDVKGVVRRSNGPDTAWVNDANTLRSERLPDGLRVSIDSQGRARVTLPNRKAVVLQPGQSYDPASGRTGGIRIQKSE